MRKFTAIRVVGVLVSLLGAGLGHAGCASRFGDFCQSTAECSGGNDADIAACVAETEGSEAVASAYDCADPYTKLADCRETTGTCKSHGYRTDCHSQELALAKCVEAASANGNTVVSQSACGEYEEKATACCELGGSDVADLEKQCREAVAKAASVATEDACAAALAALGSDCSSSSGVCGDGVCDADEDASSCAGDCGAPGDNSCEFAFDGVCDEPDGCDPGTDTADCGSGGSNSCEFAFDGVCDEPDGCDPGTDTADCQ